MTLNVALPVEVLHTDTPTEQHGDLWLKRDDLYTYAGVSGGKVRTCVALAHQARNRGYSTLVTAGSRHSPQVEIVAHVGAAMGFVVHCHVPAGVDTPQLASAAAQGAALHRHRPGHNSVIVARARTHAAECGGYEIPFGMECMAAVEANARQVDTLPALGPRRIVVPVGSGMTLAGITWGFERTDMSGHLPVLGVVVGADPAKRLDKWAHPLWRRMVTLVRSEHGYHEHVAATVAGGLVLDPVYEAKCVPYLQPGDLLWIVGRRLA